MGAGTAARRLGVADCGRLRGCLRGLLRDPMSSAGEDNGSNSPTAAERSHR
jgi:hypothetical protein